MDWLFHPDALFLSPVTSLNFCSAVIALFLRITSAVRGASCLRFHSATRGKFILQKGLGGKKQAVSGCHLQRDRGLTAATLAPHTPLAVHQHYPSPVSATLRLAR